MNINLSFKARFAPSVKSGEKRQTIRPRGKRQAQVGDVLHLFTGMRTKRCERLADAMCLLSEEIVIDTRGRLPVIHASVDAWDKIGTGPDIARLDGFESIVDMFSFFKEQYGEGKHEMILYRW